jgi:hypothetical protein
MDEFNQERVWAARVVRVLSTHHGWRQAWTRADSVRLGPSQQKARARSGEPEPAHEARRANIRSSARARW